MIRLTRIVFAGIAAGIAGALALSCSDSASIAVPSNRYALVIGVQDYPGTSNDLSYPDDDASELAALLATKGWTVTTKLISTSDSANIATDGSPSRDEIEAAIALMSSDSSATVLVYYSGHGSVSDDGSTAYIIPYDGLIYDSSTKKTSSDENAWITPADMTNWLAAVPAKHRILILDSCYSGGFALSDDAVDTTPAAYGEYEDGTSEAGIVAAALSDYGSLIANNVSSYGDTEVLTLAAAGSNEYSWDDSEHDNGAFTYYLLDAAGNGDGDGDGLVSVDEAYAYAKAKIESVWDAAYSSVTSTAFLSYKAEYASDFWRYYHREIESWADIYDILGYIPDFLPHVSGGTGDLVLYADD